MALTKSRAGIWSSVSLVAATPQTSSSVDLTAAYGANLQLSIVNGGTGPTVPAQIQIQVSDDNSNWYNYLGPFVAGTANSTTYSFDVPIPIGAMYMQLVASGNTVQNVTINASVAKVTAL